MTTNAPNPVGSLATTHPALHWPVGEGPEFLRHSDPRSRLLSAMALAVNAGSYEKTTVADVVRIARASRRTFYEHFEDRAECFLALGDELTDYLLGVVAQAAGRPGSDWNERLNVSLDTYLQLVAANPGLTRSFLIEMFGLGSRGIAHRRKQIRQWAQQLRALIELYRPDFPHLNPLSPETAMAIAGGIWELSLLAAEEDRPDDVSDIRRVATQLIVDVLTAPRAGD